MRQRTASLALAFCCILPAAWAGSLGYCERGPEARPEDQDRMLRVAGIVKQELEASGQVAALVSRSGLSLGWLGQRYSHAGVSSRNSAHAPWSVRQLYFACDEQRPRLYDQGMTGFVVGVEDPALGYLSIVTLPPEAARRLDEAVRDNAGALALLGPDYSANAYPYSTQYQNCNQWLAELMALAWADAPRPADRAQAQAWLQARNYQPTELQAWRPLIAVAHLFSWLHFDDHPDALLSRGLVRFSLPPALERFARQQWAEAERVEICYTREQIVIHRGWDDIPDGCVAREGDTVMPLDPPGSSS